jgi:alpha-L-fucosidase 2
MSIRTRWRQRRWHAAASGAPTRRRGPPTSPITSALFGRVLLDLGRGTGSDLPTDERIRRYAAEPDPALVTLLFQYGRYLLITSSRPGTQPANLQGIWNDEDPPTLEFSNYTININTQMNYWPAESTNLAECHHTAPRLSSPS